MKEKEHIQTILTILDDYYPKEVICYLNHRTPFELLIATILSAQCTDERVNMVTPSLFEKYPTVYDFAQASLGDVEEAIKSTGFNEHNGEVPSNLDELVKLAGVGRKTANVIRGNIFKIPSIVVDTHVKRISIRWGLTLKEDPVQIEMDLMKKLPKEHWIRYNTQVIAHGRVICTARNPKCRECMFIKSCPFGLNNLLAQMPEEVKEAIQKGHMY